MDILTNCLKKATDEGSIKVACSLAKYIKKRLPDVEVISYGERHALCDHHLRTNRLMLSGQLMKLLRARRELILFLPFPAKFLTTAVRTFILSLCTRRKLCVVLPMRSPKIGRSARMLMKGSRAQMIVLSHDVYKDYTQLFGHRVTYIKAGVDTEKFVPVSEERRKHLREKYGIPKDKPVLLHVGHMKNGRNIGTLLSLDEKYHVVLVASRHLMEERDQALYDQLAARQNITIIDRYIPNIENVYQMADVYYFPVVDEKNCISAPLSVLEGAACGLPVVCTHFAELKQFEGKEGFYFIESFAPDALNARIDAAIRDGRGGRGSVMEYDWKLAAERIVTMEKAAR